MLPDNGKIYSYAHWDCFLLFQIRNVMFIDNHFGLKDLIATSNSVMFPVDPDKPYTPVAIEDLAKVAAVILSAPGLHQDKTYHIASDRFSLGELTMVSIYSNYILPKKKTFYHLNRFSQSGFVSEAAGIHKELLLNQKIFKNTCTMGRPFIQALIPTMPNLSIKLN